MPDNNKPAKIFKDVVNTAKGVAHVAGDVAQAGVEVASATAKKVGETVDAVVDEQVNIGREKRTNGATKLAGATANLLLAIPIPIVAKPIVAVKVTATAAAVGAALGEDRVDQGLDLASNITNTVSKGTKSLAGKVFDTATKNIIPKTEIRDTGTPIIEGQEAPKKFPSPDNEM